MALALDIERRLGDDLVALLRDRPAPLVDARCVSSRPERSDGPAAYRLELADGSVLQGRRLASPRRAHLVERLTRLAGAAFPEPIACRGAALLTPWIEGTPLSSIAPLEDGLVERAGEILAALHRVPVPGWRRLPIRTPADLRARLDDDLALLVGAGLLERASAERARGEAAEAMPTEAGLGIIHSDFCAENLVLTADRALVAVDNGTLTFAPHDLDLARTWHRWPMTPLERAAFLGAYERGRSGRGFLRHFRFWAVVALAGAAANRVRAEAGGFVPALERLASLLASPADGTALWERG